MHKRDQVVAHIYTAQLKKLIKDWKECNKLLQQAIDEEESEEEIISNAKVVEEQKLKAKTKKQLLREEMKERAREWARLEESKRQRK
jgi:hypothetical protein